MVSTHTTRMTCPRVVYTASDDVTYGTHTTSPLLYKFKVDEISPMSGYIYVYVAENREVITVTERTEQVWYEIACS